MRLYCVTIDGVTNVMPFGSTDEALAFVRAIPGAKFSEVVLRDYEIVLLRKDR